MEFVPIRANLVVLRVGVVALLFSKRGRGHHQGAMVESLIRRPPPLRHLPRQNPPQDPEEEEVVVE